MASYHELVLRAFDLLRTLPQARTRSATGECPQEFQGELPLAAIADPEKQLYAEFGAVRKMSPLAALSPRSWLAAGRALTRAPSQCGATGKGEDHLGLPADFLIGPDGRVLAAHYGRLVDDHWSVDELLNLARQATKDVSSSLRGVRSAAPSP